MNVYDGRLFTTTLKTAMVQAATIRDHDFEQLNRTLETIGSNSTRQSRDERKAFCFPAWQDARMVSTASLAGKVISMKRMLKRFLKRLAQPIVDELVLASVRRPNNEAAAQKMLLHTCFSGK